MTSRTVKIVVSVIVVVSAIVTIRLLLGGNDARSATLHLNWVWSGSFAGEAIAVAEIAPSRGFKLQAKPGGQGLDPLKLVRRGDFGVAAADEILRANDKGADFVIIGVLNDVSPAAFVSLASSGISSPRDFPGKRVGVLPFGSTGLVYQSMMKSAGIDRALVTEVVVSPDLRPFISGATHDVQPVFVFDEPVTLDAQGIKYNLILPSAFGVAFKGMCYFTTRSTIEEMPETVRDFVQIMAEAWRRTRENPARAVDLLRGIDGSIDAGRELALLSRGMSFFVDDTRRPLDSDPDSWAPMIEDLKSFGVISEIVNADEFLDLRFVP